MSTIQTTTRRYIRFNTIESTTAWIIVAVLVEQTGSETRVSPPRIMRVVPKAVAALAGTVAGNALSGPTMATIAPKGHIPSPYSPLFSIRNSGILAHIGARAPTRRT